MKHRLILLVILLFSAGCGDDVRVVECQIGHVNGKFLTTTYELETDGLVRMWRDDRLFMWPKDRIVVCAEPGEELGGALHGEFPTTVPAISAWSAPLGDGTERFAPSGFFSMAGHAGKCRKSERQRESQRRMNRSRRNVLAPQAADLPHGMTRTMPIRGLKTIVGLRLLLRADRVSRRHFVGDRHGHE